MLPAAVLLMRIHSKKCMFVRLSLQDMACCLPWGTLASCTSMAPSASGSRICAWWRCESTLVRFETVSMVIALMKTEQATIHWLCLRSPLSPAPEGGGGAVCASNSSAEADVVAGRQANRFWPLPEVGSNHFSRSRFRYNQGLQPSLAGSSKKGLAYRRSLSDQCIPIPFSVRLKSADDAMEDWDYTLSHESPALASTASRSTRQTDSEEI